VADSLTRRDRVDARSPPAQNTRGATQSVGEGQSSKCAWRGTTLDREIADLRSRGGGLLPPAYGQCAGRH